MKSLCFLSVFLVFLSNSWAAEPSLTSFCEHLDKTLRKVNSSAPTASCHSEKQKALYTRPTTYQGKTTSLLTPDEAQSLFKEMAAQDHIAFKFPVDGCFDRANEMTRLMLLKGIKPLKGFLSVREEKGGGYKHYLQLADKAKPDDPWRWTDHVAPVVMVQDKGKMVPYVIDPSAETKAVTFEQWKKNLSKHDKKIKLDTEIGRTGQYVIGSPLDMDFQDPAQVERLKTQIAKYKSYEQSKTGLNDYIGDELWDRDDTEGKLDAMSGGK
ncbi:hypothetical protein AZI86_00130 [Bdellovibrio bacteriovorus]|uniref:Protein glutaminase domain-containing protein n=1 Tax=Bdellovibrio bacteriovorus TaxID=959 RepID=A0A150WM42_BDEBC|nr:protein-glutamine glutaminase family protein [Bdellovibrio bacteriovorus]KYG65522.1 hypothetical protein AZI86_00130 [Bdellovibrio bacteriovorus]